MGNAITELKRLSTEATRRQHPNMPAHAIPPPKYSDKTANGLTRCIIAYLRLQGCQAERVSSTGRVIADHTGGQKWIKGNGTKGTADISATIRGRSVKVEVKIGRDRQSEAQRAYQREVEQAGGVYVIATTFEQFYEWFTSYWKGASNGR